MKIKLHIIILIVLIVLISCKFGSNNPEFIGKVTGNYLYTEDELIKVYAKDNAILLDWRGAEGIKTMRTGDDTFYVKEMNAKIRFLTNLQDEKMYLVFIPKNKDSAMQYKHIKVAADFKTPSQWLAEGDYHRALQGFQAIKIKDSLNPIIRERRINYLGYDKIDERDYQAAIALFRINAELYPKSSNVYDSLGEAYQRNKDTANAILNYQKSLELDSGNRRAKQQIKKLQKKDATKK